MNSFHIILKSSLELELILNNSIYLVGFGQGDIHYGNTLPLAW